MSEKKSKKEISIDYLRSKEVGLVEKLSYAQNNLEEILNYFNNEDSLGEFFNLVHDLLQDKKCKILEYEALVKILKNKDEKIEEQKGKVEDLNFQLREAQESLFDTKKDQNFSDERKKYFSILEGIVKKLAPFSYSSYCVGEDSSLGLNLEKINTEFFKIMDNFIYDLAKSDKRKAEYFEAREEIRWILTDRAFSNDYAFLQSVKTLVTEMMKDLTKFSSSTQLMEHIEFWEEREKDKLMDARKEMVLARRSEEAEEYEKYLELRDKFEEESCCDGECGDTEDKPNLAEQVRELIDTINDKETE